MRIRDDLSDAHRRAWEHIAGPGSWWTGAQRLELATTVMVAIVDPEPLPPWVGISVAGRLPDDHLAPAAAHDVAYRIARHAGTMTEEIYRSVVDEIGELPYVELCAIVSSVAAVVHFCRNVGLDVPPLPEVVAGEPSGEQPDQLAAASYNWVPVAAPADRMAAVVQAYTGVPGELTNTWRLADAQYMPASEMTHADWSRRAGGLTRPQMELVAARVAQLRECFY